MAPRPIESSFRARVSKPNQKPSIYAIASGPQKGVHLLSATPLPAEIQYLYRHPINVHKTFLTVNGDFLRRRFESIEAAIRWIDEMDRERELVESLASTSLQEETAVVEVDDDGLKAPPTTPERPRRASEPVYRFSPRMVIAETAVLGKAKANGDRICKKPTSGWRGKYGMCHLGARRREMIYDLVAGGGDPSEYGAGDERMEVEEIL